MRKLTLFIATLLLTVAKTVAFEVSTLVANPEHQYFITNGNNAKVGKNAVNSNEAGCFAFYAVEGVDNAYYIYSLDEKKWFNYVKEASYGGRKNFITLSSNKDNYFYIESCANSAGFYQIRPYNTTGVADIYLNYYQGVDGSSTIGLWTENGDGDAGSRWSFIEAECVYEIDDLSNDKVYNLTTTRGWLIYNASNADQVSSTASYTGFTTGMDVEACQWAIYKSEKTAKYYLYNIGAGKFVGKNSNEGGRFPFVATVTNDIQVVKSTTGTSHALVFSTDNYGAINHFNHTAAPGVANWKGNANAGGLRALDDAGSAHRAVEVGAISNETLATITELVAVYETLPELDAAIVAAEAKAAEFGDAIGLYSYTEGNYGEVLQSIKDFRSAIDENTTLAEVEEKIAILTAMPTSKELNTPQVGKYYRLKNAVSNRYMSANSEGNGVVVIDNGAEAASTIFYLEEGNVFRSYTRNLYLDCSAKSLSDSKKNGLFEVAYNNAPTANTITYRNNNFWVFGNRNNGVSIDRGSSKDQNGYNWIIEEVTMAAKIGDKQYYTLDEAATNVKSGQTLTLLASTNETIVLPMGVTLVLSEGVSAPNVTVKQPVAKIGETGYETFDEAYTAAKNGDVIELFETAVISKTMANYNKKTITVKANGLETAFLVKSSVMMGTFAGMTIETDGTCVTFGTTAGDYNPTVDINGGTYKGGTSAITVVSGLVRIADGVFSATDNANTIVGDIKNVNVNGGKFYNFDPTSYIPNNRIAQKGTDGYYTVAEAAAKIGDVKYADLASAISAAQAGETVTLLRNINLGDITSAVIVKKSITIDGEGYWTITINSVNDTYNKGAFAPRGPISYTFKNLTVDLKNAASDMAAFNMKYGGTLENVTVKGAFGQAVSVTMAYPVTVTNCAFDGATWGVYASSSNVKVNVTGTTFNTTGAVYLHQYGELVFTDNIVAADSYIETDATVDVSKNFWNGNNATGNAPAAAQLKGDNIICDTYYAANANGVLGNLTENGVAETAVIKIELDGETYEYGPSKLSLISKLLGSSTQADAVKVTLLDNVTLENGMQIAAYIEDGTLAITPKSVEVDLGGKTLTGFIQVNANVTATIKNGTVTATNNTYPGVDVAGKVTLDKVTINAENDVRVSAEAELIASAKIGNTYYATLADALTAAQNGDVVTLLWSEGKAPIAMNGSVYGKDITITGTATVDWSKGFLFVGRGGEGNATVTFDGANLTSASNSASYGIHVSGREKNTNNKYDGTVVIKNSTIVLDYLINKGAMTLDKATLTVKNGFAIGGRPASETESGADATATISLTNESKLVVNNHNGMGLGYEAIGVMNIDATSTFETTQSFLVTAKGTMNIAGTAKVEGSLTNNGAIVLTADAATLTSTECGNVTTNVANKVVSYIDGKYTLTAAVAQIGDKYYATLQAAVNAVQNGETITLTSDVTENVTLTEKVGLYYTIDGASKKMNGTITVSSLSDTNDNRRITIKNINFVDTENARDFITSVNTNHYPRLTVEGCTFTGTGKEAANSVALRLKSSHSVVIKDCTGTGLHSFLQNTSGWNLTVENVTVTDSKSGLALGTVQGVTVKGANIDVEGYGIRLDAQYNNNAVIESNTVKAFIPVVVRKASVDSNIEVKGTNTFTASNEDGLWMAIGTSEYEANGQMPTAATAQVKVDLTDTGLDAAGIYGSYYDALTIHVGAAQNSRTVTRDIYVATMDKAVAEAKAINAGAVTYKVYGEVELTTGGSHGILDLGKNVVIEGADATAKLTIVGGGVPDIKGVTFKNIILADEGTYLPTANEFMYQNYIDCTFENVTFVDGIRLSGTSSIKDSKVDANTTNEYAIWLDAGEFTMTGTTVVGGADAYGLVKSDAVSKITITGNTFQYLGEANKEALNVKEAVIIAENNQFIECTKGIVPADKTNYADENKTTTITDATIAGNNTVTVYYAAIGAQKFESFDAAVAAAQAGNEVVILKAGTYALKVKDGITITGAVDGVEFANIGAHNMGGANVTFNNVTFTYAENSTYKGLQHSGNLVYNNCTINGQVFLYGQSETFNNCTFTTTDSNNYNVWTYGAKVVAFNECTFNSAGKSVLIYNESASVTNNVTVTKSQFIASQAVEGKAAIEMDSSLSGAISLTIDGETTATGFGTGNVSGNSLWNNKKGNSTDANNDITVKVGDETVLAPVTFVAKIGNNGYTAIADAIKAAQVGETVTILAGNYTTNIDVNKAITVVGATDAEGNNLVNVTGNVSVNTGATVKNLNVHNDATGDYACALDVNGKDIVLDGVNLSGYNAMRYCYATGNITIKNSTLTSRNFTVHFDGKAGGNVSFENCDITGWCSYASTIGTVSYTNSTIAQGPFAGHRYFNKNISFTECDFAEGFKVELKASGTTVAFTDADMTMADAEALFKDPYYVANGNITVNGTKVAYEASGYVNGASTYGKLQDIINGISSGNYITLRSDNVHTEPIVIPAGKKVEIGGLDKFKLEGTITLEAGAILDLDSSTVPEGLTVTTDVAGNKVVYDGNTYKVESYAVQVTYPAGNPVYAEGKVEYYDDMLEAVPYTTNCPRLEGATITLLKDVAAAGLRFMENGMVFDLNGHTYTITAGTGSQGTNTSGFQIRPEVTTNVIFKNGTINVAEGAPVCWMFNSYATQFIVENVTVDCANMAWSYGSSCLVVVSRAEDDVQFLGTTEVKNFNAEVAGDAYSVGGTMTVAETAIVPGTFKLGVGAVLTAPAGLEVKPADGYKVVYADGVYTSVATRAEVATKAELNAALANADIETIVMTADIDYGTTQLAITKAITLDLGGYTLTTANAYGGMSIKNNPTIKNGTIVHKSNTAAIKVWNATAFEDLVIDVQGKGDAGKTIGGIVLQSGSTTKVGSIKNVTIKGAALTNGIETYNCGDATENVIGAMENVTIDAQGTGLLISAPCGTATNCSISGGVTGIELWIKGNYSATLALVDSDVKGGEKPVYVHDEFSTNPDIQNNGTLKLAADDATNFTSESGALAAVNIARAENVECEVVDALIENAIVCVGDVYFDNFAKAWAAVKAGQTVTLLADLEASDVILIDKSMTINGNGHKVTSSASRVFRVTASNAVVTLNNVNMVDTKASSYTADIRGISIDASLQNVKLTLNNCSVDFTDASACDWSYAVNVSGSGTGHTVTVNGGTYEGANVINAHGANNTIVVKDATLTSLYPNNDVYYGACVWVLQNQGSSVEATGNTFNGSNTMVFNVGTGTTVTESNNTDNTTMCVAKIGNEYYTSLAAAFAVGGEVKVLQNIVLSETATVPAGKTITLDLNGKTISQEKACTASYEMINNKGNLTITGEGKISFKDTGAGDPNFGWGSYTVRNEGTLVVENGTIEHLGEQAAHMYCAIFQYSGKSTINGGTISTPNYRSARLWKGEMTVNGGNFEGQLWVQAVDNTSNLVINGGTFAPRGNDGSSVFVTNSTYDVALAVTGGTFETKIGCSDASKLAGAITGGTFSATAKENTAAALIATGYVFGEADANGYYTIADDPATHYINNVEEFVAFRDAVNGGNDFAGVAVYLTADIDLTGIDWSVNIGDDAGATFDGTFDGQGHTIKNLTSTETAQKGDGYICTGLFGAIHGGAVLKDFTIENVTINTGDFTGNNVAAVVGFAWKATGSIENVHVTGNININAKNVTGVGAILGYDYYSPALTVKNCSVIGNDGSAILGKSYVGGLVGYASSKIALNNNTVENVSVTATGSVGAIAGIMLGGSSAADNTVKNVALTANGELWKNSAAVVAGTITGGAVTVADNTVENVTANGAVAALVGGQLVEKPTAPIAKVEAKIGDKYYTTLEAAYTAAQAGATIELLAPVVIASGETLRLDKDVTVVYTSNVAGEDMFTNRGTLNISAGTITYANTDATGSNVTVSTISSEPGSVLNITGGTVENKTVKTDGSSIYSFAIDMLTNGNLGDVTATIAGGTVSSDYMAIRQFNNGTACKNTLNITGGYIYGAKRAVQVHLNNNAAYTTISGGKVEAGADGYAICNFAATGNLEVTGGEFIGAVYSARENFISGGIYDAEVYAGYCAEGYMPNKNVDGTYGVVLVANAYASIDGVTYGSLKAAVAAAKAGETITLLQDVKENVTISKHLTIDGAGKTIIGMITTDGKSLKVTIKNVNFDGNNKTVNYAMRADDDLNLVVENCSVKDYLYGFLYANKSNDKIVVKNVTVENCAEYGAYLVAFNSASFENFTVEGNTKYGIAVANAGDRTVNLKNVSFEGAETPLHINELGTGKVTFKFSGINDMSKAEFYTSEYVNVVAAAQVGTKVCGSIQDAVVAANDGDTVKVLADVNMTTANFVTQVDGYATLVNVAGKAVTIDLNGKKVTVNAAHADLNGKAKGNMLMSVFHADPNGTLTLTDSSAEGTGTVELFANDATVYGLIVSENANDKSHPGKIIVNGGNYIADKLTDSMIFADINEVITVNGGNFRLGNVGTGSNGKPWIFNAAGNNQIHINVNGGTYNANVAKQYWTNEVNLGAGLTTTNNGDGTWTVVPAVAEVVDGDIYGSIQEAIDAAQDGQTVKLVADVALDTKKYTTQVDNLVVLFNVKGKAVTFDLNGKKIDVNASAANLGGKMLAGVFSADVEGDFTITDSSAEGTGAVTVTVNDAKVYSVFISENAGDKTKSGKMTVNAGNFTTVGKVANAMIFADTDKVVTINGGTFICDGVSVSENYPWLINTHDNNVKQVIVNGGTFNVDINHQYRPFEVFVPENLAVKANGNGTWTIVPAQAYVTEMLGNYVNEPGNNEHKVGYATVAEAIAATNNLGKTVTILAGDYTGNLNVNKGITVQGETDAEGNNLVTFNGKLSITADGATVKNINFNNSGTAAYVGAKDVTIDGCSLVGSNGLYQSYTSGTVTFKNSYIKGGTYGIHFDGNAGGNIVIDNCTVIGWTSFAGTITNVAISGTTFAEGNYNQLRLYQNATITDCTFNEKMNIDWNSSNKTAEFTNCSVEGDKDLTEIISLANIATKGLKVTVDGELICVAAKVDNKYYLSLQAAIDAATEGQTVTIVSDLALTEGVTVAADKSIFIDLNGKTITGTPDEAKAYAVITNKGTLTIQGEGAIVCNHTLAGSTSYAVNTIVNSGYLTIDGATIENKSIAQYQIGYAIDNNSTSADAVVTVVSGKVTASGSLYYDGIRQFCNSMTNENSVVVEGGEVSTIWMQNPSDGATKNAKDVMGSVTVEGGNVGVLSLEPSANFEAAMTGGHVGEISYFQIAEGRDLVEFVTGGTLGTQISEEFLAWGYQLTGNAAPYNVEYTGCREEVTFIDGQFTEYTNEKELEVGKLTYQRANIPTTWTPFYVPFEVDVQQLAAQGFEVAYINGVRRDDVDYDGELDKFVMEIIYIHSQDVNKVDGSRKTLKANYPYFIRSYGDTRINLDIVLEDATLYPATDATYDCTTMTERFELIGNLSKVTIKASDDTALRYVVSGGEWSKRTKDSELNPFRFSMELTSRNGSDPTIDAPAMMSIAIRGEQREDGTTLIYDVEMDAQQPVDYIYDLQGRRVLEPEKGNLYIINGKKVIF